MIGPDEQHEWTDLLVDISGTVDDGLTLLLSGAGEAVVAGPDLFTVPTGEIADLMSSLQPTIKRSSRPEVTDPAKAAGSRLFETLFGGPRARFYPRVREMARRRGAGVCVRLRTEDPRLHELPWELLYDTTADRADFLALDPAVCVVRSGEPAPAPRPLVCPPSPLRVVVDGGPGAETAEVARLSSLRTDPALVEVSLISAVAAPADVWHVVRGDPTMSVTEATAPLVIVHLGAEPNPYTTPAMAAWVPAVVDLSWTMTEQAGNAFVESFYRALFAGAAIQDAISAGRRDADYAQPGGRHWASVICYLTGGGPVVDPGGSARGDPSPRSMAPGADYADLRGTLARQNLDALREQAARLGPAAPATLQRQIDELQRAVADHPGMP